MAKCQGTRPSDPPVHPARGRSTDYGRSPGSRVAAAIQPSRPNGTVASADGSSSLTVAGAALALTNFSLGPRYWVSGEP
jgi:hypothetical protein